VHGHVPSVCFLLLLCLAIVVPVLPPQSPQMLVFEKVWGRSFCRTIEKLVEVVQEYPSEVEHIYSPSCVPLVRCAGCCGDENLECHPTQTTNVTMQLLKIRPSEQGQEYVEMTFVEHQTCESGDSNSWVDLLTCPYADGQGVFVTTRFNRKCVLTGGNTAVTSLKQWTSLGASAM
uniref:Placental growth factor b n=1 Tax=Neolamprologus brichardi TaxID=32507 RepID=A0A3Q4GJW5_NEOBR